MGRDFEPSRGGGRGAPRGGGDRGGRGGGFRGGGDRGGRGGFGGRGGGGRGGGFSRGFDNGPPQRVEEFGTYSHSCGNQILVAATVLTQVPKFFRMVYFENKTPIGKVDEILGPVDGYLFSVDLEEGLTPDSFKAGQKIYMDPYDTLPIDRFTGSQANSRGGGARGGRGAPRGGPRGGGGFRGAPRGGGFRGAPRGGGFRGGAPRGGGFRGAPRGGGFRGASRGGY